MTNRNAATTIEDENMDSWVVAIERNVELYDPTAYLTKLMKKSIYKWPNDLVMASDMKSHRTPLMASFGPYHHGEKHLQPMDHHKERALYRILQRSKASISDFMNSLRQVLQELRDNYDDLNPELSSNSFLRMMLFDGCFMLELLRIYDSNRISFHEIYDPIFSPNGKLTHTVACRDMLLLENQIPLLVLRKLLEVEERREINDYACLNRLIFNLYGLEDLPIHGPSLHILDIYRKCLIKHSITIEKTTPSVDGFIKSGCLRCQPMLHAIGQGLKHMLLAMPILVFRLLGKRIFKAGNIRSAMRFHETGIEFKKGEPDSGLRITFDYQHGVLTLPYLIIEDNTAAIYMNLMALERMHPKLTGSEEVTKYVSFMDQLIDTAEDVNLLCSRGIVENILGSDEDAAKIFNKLGDGIEDCMDLELYQQLQAYAASNWNAARAYLKQKYFQNPWSILSLLAAIVLLVLTFIQTLFSVLAVKHVN